MEVASADYATVASKRRYYVEILPWGYLLALILCTKLPLLLEFCFTAELANSMNA